jgi:glutathione S-transferase
MSTNRAIWRSRLRWSEAISTLIFHSAPVSPYLWAATLCAYEKGVSFRVEQGEKDLPSFKKLHPFGKMPVMQHGDLILYETAAIAFYIANAFDGPRLLPADIAGQACAIKWMSVVSNYAFSPLNGLVKQRLVAPSEGKAPDEVAIGAFVSALPPLVDLIEEALADGGWLVGAEMSIADLFLFPHLHLACFTPEGKAAFANAKATQNWLSTLQSRPSFAATNILAR